MMLGLSAYPTDSYYDPNRPRWVPYWFDTPTESAMKWGAFPGADTKTAYPLPPRPSGPTVPPGGYEGSVTNPNAVDVVVSTSAAAYRNNLQDFFGDVGSALDAEEEEKNRKARNQLMFVAAGVAVFFLLRS